MPPAKTTIYSLARELDTSPATVSKALNHSPEISAELRGRVQALARKHGFKPRTVSRRIANIGLLVQNYAGHPFDFTSSFFGLVLEGVAEYVREAGLELSLFARDVEELNRVDLVRELKSRSIDGVVVLCGNDQSHYYRQLRAQHYHHCSLINNDGRSEEDLLRIDNQRIGATAGRHLLELGHRHLGVIATPPDSPSARERLAGFRQALAQAQLTLDDTWVEEVPDIPFGYEGGRQSVQRLLRRQPTLTAVFCMSTETAIGALRGCAELGRRVPDEVSVIACDDYPQSAYSHPPLTTVDIPNRRLGYVGAMQVHRLIQGLAAADPAQYLNPGGTLVVRTSCSPPRV